MSKRFDAQTLMAIGVLVVSFMALFISVRQTSIMSEQTRLLVEQNKASAWPHLEVGLSRSFIGNDTDGYEIDGFVLNIENKGTGPAIVEGVRVLFDGKPARNWSRLYELTQVPDSIGGGHSNSTLMNTVIASNERIDMLNLSSNKELMNWVYNVGDKISLEICYRSVYDDYWLVTREGFKTNLEQTHVKRGEGCKFSADEMFME